jgi:hypothetical protein
MPGMIRFLQLKHLPATAIVVVLSSALAGCGGNRAAVEGSVTLDGKPVDGGIIAFIPDDGKSGEDHVKAHGEIKGGKYALSRSEGPNPGKYKVTINWPKKTGRKVDAPGDPGVKMDEVKEAVPARYNKQTTLVIEIKSGSNTKDYELKSDGTSKGDSTSPSSDTTAPRK